VRKSAAAAASFAREPAAIMPCGFMITKYVSSLELLFCGACMLKGEAGRRAVQSEALQLPREQVRIETRFTRRAAFQQLV